MCSVTSVPCIIGTERADESWSLDCSSLCLWRYVSLTCRVGLQFQERKQLNICTKTVSHRMMKFLLCVALDTLLSTESFCGSFELRSSTLMFRLVSRFRADRFHSSLAATVFATSLSHQFSVCLRTLSLFLSSSADWSRINKRGKHFEKSLTFAC